MRMLIANALVAGGLLIPACGRSEPADPPRPETSHVPTRLAATTHFEPGQVHHYDVDWTVHGSGQMAQLGEAPVSGGLRLRGKLELHVYAGDGEHALLGLRMVELDEAALEVMGANVLADGAQQLLERESILRVSTQGHARQLWMPPNAPPVYRHLMTGLLTNVDFVAARPTSEDTWTSVTRNAHGLAEVDYQRDGTTLSRQTRGYERIDAVAGTDPRGPWNVEGSTEIALDPDGVPLRIAGVEMVTLTGAEDPIAFSSRAAFELTRTAVTHAAPRAMPELSTWTEVDLHDPPDEAAAERELARKFAEGMTRTELATMVLSAGYGVRPAAGELIRARGLLRGWPETTDELRPAYADAPDLRTRRFIVDLLVSADTPQSQALLLELLPGPEDPELVKLAQHLSLLRTPIPEVGQRLLEAHADATNAGDERTRRGLLYPIGTLSRSLQGSDVPLAERMVQEVRDALAIATDPDDLVAAVAALGNAERPDDVPALRALASHDDVGVRAQVASSLRQSRDAASVDLLFAMLEDPDRHVAASALSTIDGGLAAQTPHLHRLAMATMQGAVHSELTGPLVSVLAHHGGDDAIVRGALVALWQRARDPHERGRLFRMLGLASA